jgi:hypothetical protein
LTLLVDVYAGVINALGLGDTAIGRGINSIKGFRDLVTGALDDTAAGFAESAAEISMAQDSVNGAIQQGSELIQKAYGEELEAVKAQADGTIESQTKKVEKIKVLTEEEIAALEKLKTAKQGLRAAEEEDRLLQQGNDAIFTEEKLIALQEFFTAEQEASIQAKLNLVENEFDKQRLITEAQTAAITNRQKMEQDNLKELRKGQDEYTDFLKATAKDRESNQRSTLSNISSLSQSSSKELAAIGKAAGIAQIAIDTPVAISKALAAFPPPINFIAAGAVGAAMATQAARIAGLNFEQGGVVPGTSFTGDNVAANVNSGEMILNKQQQANLFKLAQNGGDTAGQNMQITVQSVLDGNVVAESVSNWVANGGQLGEVQ